VRELLAVAAARYNAQLAHNAACDGALAALWREEEVRDRVGAARRARLAEAVAGQARACAAAQRSLEDRDATLLGIAALQADAQAEQRALEARVAEAEGAAAGEAGAGAGAGAGGAEDPVALCTRFLSLLVQTVQDKELRSRLPPQAPWGSPGASASASSSGGGERPGTFSAGASPLPPSASLRATSIQSLDIRLHAGFKTCIISIFNLFLLHIFEINILPF
jgi:hypothetical protein